MSIRHRLSRIEHALSVKHSPEVKVTSADLDHLTDDELDRLEHIVMQVGEITKDTSVPIISPSGDDVRASISWIVQHEAEYLAAVRSLVDEGSL